MANKELTAVPAATLPLDGTEYMYIVQGGNTRYVLTGEFTVYDAIDITYDNATSGLSATDVQTALDELALSISEAGGILIDGDKGDITLSGSGTVWTIDNDVVTNAKLANMATQTFKGRTTAGTGDPEDLTVTQATALLNNVVGDSGAGGTKGLVPAPAAGDTAAGKFLKADGAWAVPAGAAALDDLSDVDAPTPADGDVLTFDTGSGDWVSAAPVGGSNALDDLTDVNAPTPADGDVLTWDSTPGEWVPVAPTGGASALDDLTDVDAPTPADGDVLTFDSGSGDWVPAAPGAGGGTIGRHTIWIPFSSMLPAATSGCATAQLETTTNKINHMVGDFDGTADEYAHFNIAFPKSWDLGALTFQVLWSTTATDSDGVAWGLQAVAISDNGASDAAFGTPVVVTDDAQGAAGEILVTAESGALTVGGTPAADDVCFFRVFRDVSDANDDMTEDARLLGVKLFYTIDAETDD